MLELFYAAVASEYGIVITCSPSADAVKRKLYVVKKDHWSPELDNISICTSPTNPNELWLVKRKSNGLDK